MDFMEKLDGLYDVIDFSKGCESHRRVTNRNGLDDK